jgi:hypothetical protein
MAGRGRAARPKTRASSKRWWPAILCSRLMTQQDWPVYAALAGQDPTGSKCFKTNRPRAPGPQLCQPAVRYHPAHDRREVAAE